MSLDLPALPAAYELVALDSVDSVVEEAARRARMGAGEGTLVWAREQTDARTGTGKPWFAPSGNLHCALIIQPDYDNVTAQQLLYVAMLSAGTAIAETVSAMTGLRWRWPDEIFVNDLKCGMVQIAAPGGDAEPYPWMVLGASINVAEHPPNPEPERFNSIHASGTPEANVVQLLEGTSRHFLAWINRWAEEGFRPVHRAWTLRADGIGDQITLSLEGKTLTGKLLEINAQGGADLELEDGTVRTVRVAEYFGFDNRSRDHGRGGNDRSQSDMTNMEQTPGVYFSGENGKPELVHEYLDGEYALGDLAELFAFGKLEDDGSLVVRREELRPLKVRADAESFDHEEGFIEMCLDIWRFCSAREDESLRFKSVE